MRKRTKSFSKTFDWSPSADIFFKTWLGVMDEKPKKFTIRAGKNIVIRAIAKINGNDCKTSYHLNGASFNPSALKRNPDGFLKALVEVVGAA